MLSSCAEEYVYNIDVEKPQSTVQDEQLAALEPLKSYVDASANPNFKLGLAVNGEDYAKKEITYSLALSNFNSVVDRSALSYGNTTDETGSANFGTLTGMFLEDAPAVLGSTMFAYNSLNKTYLEENVISPNFVKGDYEAGKYTLFSFEDDALDTQYGLSNEKNNTVCFVADDPQGPENGHVLQIGSPEKKAQNNYPVFNISMPDNLTLGNCVSVVFDIYCVDNNSQTRPLVLIVNGKRFNSQETPQKLGCPLGDWGRRICEIKFSDVEGLTAEDLASTEFTLSTGCNIRNSYYYIDNVAINWERGEKDKYVDKTLEEQSQALADNFAQWANVAMEQVAPSVSDFVVVANAISDSDEYVLRNQENETALGNDTTNSFFLNDYMGDNYVVTLTKAVAAAYKANGGQGNPTLYVSESALLGNPGKTTRFVNQVKAWIAAGAQIGGVAVELPMNYTDGSDLVAQAKALFGSLKETGVIVRLDNVSMANANAEVYGQVVNAYLDTIPASQRGGIIFASTSDLWNNYKRTAVYGAVVDALKNH